MHLGDSQCSYIALTKQELGAGSAGSALMIKFIIYQSVLTIYSLILIFWKASFFKTKMSNLFYLIAIGFTVNASVIIFLIIFSKYRKLTHKLIIALSKIMEKLRLVKDISKLEMRINDNLDQFHDNMEIVKHSKVMMLKAVIYTICSINNNFYYTLFYLS